MVEVDRHDAARKGAVVDRNCTIGVRIHCCIGRDKIAIRQRKVIHAGRAADVNALDIGSAKGLPSQFVKLTFTVASVLR